MIYVLNEQAGRALVGAFGGSTKWRGQKVRIIPAQHFDEDGIEYWVLELRPLFTCVHCQSEPTEDMHTKIMRVVRTGGTTE